MGPKVQQTTELQTLSTTLLFSVGEFGLCLESVFHKDEFGESSYYALPSFNFQEIPLEEVALNLEIIFFYQSIFPGISVDWQSSMIFHFKARGLYIAVVEIISEILLKLTAKVGTFQNIPVLLNKFRDEN